MSFGFSAFPSSSFPPSVEVPRLRERAVTRPRGPKRYPASMAHDDWRIHVELGQGSEQGDLLERLTGALGDEAEELVKALSGERLAVSRGDAELFVYAASKSQAEHARAVIEAELSRHG